MTVSPRIMRIATLAGVATLALTACGASDSSSVGGASRPASVGGGNGSGASRVTVSVVASTDVWGDVVRAGRRALAGTTVEITSIITDPAADPHSYEANTQTQLALSKADVVIENGGGYDDFVDTMLKSARQLRPRCSTPSTSPAGRRRAAASSTSTSGTTSRPSQKVADQIARRCRRPTPHDARDVTRRTPAGVRPGSSRPSSAPRPRSTQRTGDGVAITEPVPLYMLEACGLVNRTPAEFSEAIEEGTDVLADRAEGDRSTCSPAARSGCWSTTSRPPAPRPSRC